MNHIIFGVIFLFSFLQASIADDPFLEYQKYLSRMGKFSTPSRPALLNMARNSEKGISWQDYQFLKGTSGFAASGAEWAHQADVLGENGYVLLLERAPINHADMQRSTISAFSKKPTTTLTEDCDHSSAMASLIHSVAPKATIYVLPSNELDLSLLPVQVINASFGSDLLEGFRKTFANITERDGVLIVKAAGNDQENLSMHPYTQNCERLLPFTIFTGCLGHDYKTAAWSGFPGETPVFQHSFLWTVGGYVLAATGPRGSTQYSPTSGTSNTTAIVSGAAALFSPAFSPKQVKEILLESADRDIFQEYNPDEELYSSGYRAIHIKDPVLAYHRQQSQKEKGVDSLDAQQIEHTPIVAYDKKLWGMGILNIRNALLYAEIKSAYPGETASTLREWMLKLINRKQQAKAVTIQRAFRKHQELPREILDLRRGITLNTTMKNRAFARISIPEEYYKKPKKRELTDAERLEKLGILLPMAPRALHVSNNRFPFQVTKDQWRQCSVPAGASEKLANFIQAPLHQVEKAFDTFFLEELLPILRRKSTYAANTIFGKYKELLTPFSVNKVVRLGRNWMESDVCYFSKIVYSSTTIIGLIHDGTRNKECIAKPDLVAFAICLYEKIRDEGCLTDKIQSAILALLKDNKEEGDQAIFPFLKRHNLLKHSFHAFVVKDNEETDTLELHALKLKGLDLFSEEEKQKFQILTVQVPRDI